MDISRANRVFAGAIIAVVALGVATVLIGGREPPATAPAQAASVSTAAFDPQRLHIVTTSRPFDSSWTAEANVRIRARSPQAAARDARDARTSLASADGRQTAVRITSARVENQAIDATIAIENIPAGGTYSGTLALDPLSERAASIELVVTARHAFVWPLIVLVAGMAAGGAARAIFRRRRGEAAMSPAYDSDAASNDGGRRAIIGRTLSRLRSGEFATFGVHVIFAATAFLLPVWTATEFGSSHWQYVFVIAAGCLGKLALDETRPASRVTTAPRRNRPEEEATEGKDDRSAWSSTASSRA
jgi:hypothetical protein